MPNINLSNDSESLIIESVTQDDVLDLWLNQPHLPHYRYLQLDITRNCCNSNNQSYKVYTNYPVGININGISPYSNGMPSVNDSRISFGITGISKDNIKSARAYTNRDSPNNNIFDWEDLTPDQITTSGIVQYFIVGGSPIFVPVEITSIDDIVYTITIKITPGISYSPGAHTANVETVVVGTDPAPNIDYNNGVITFDTTTLNQLSTDGKILDGVYTVDVSLYSTVDITLVESSHKFLTIKLHCIVVQSVVMNSSDTKSMHLFEALKYSNDCNITAEDQCKLYDSLIRTLIRMGHTSSVSSAGCNCGCK